MTDPKLKLNVSATLLVLAMISPFSVRAIFRNACKLFKRFLVRENDLKYQSILLHKNGVFHRGFLQ